MNRLNLKRIDFGAEDLNTYTPQIPDNFCMWLTLEIGTEEIEGSHLFQVGVCTVKWLAHQLSIKNPYVLRHMILVKSFDIDFIKKKIQEIIENSERDNWDESVKILCRYFAWEFEDYKY